VKQEKEGVPLTKKENEGHHEEDPKAKFKLTLMKLIKQIKVGCDKDICPTEYCKKNPKCKKHKSTSGFLITNYFDKNDEAHQNFYRAREPSFCK
jgi:hypothetical protein